MKGNINCPDGCGLTLNEQMIWNLESVERQVRIETNQHFELNLASGARCPVYNKLVGGAKNSAHPLGLAADPECKNSYIAAIMITHWHKIVAANRIRIGYGKKDGIIILHFDLASGKSLPYPQPDLKVYPSPRIWAY